MEHGLTEFEQRGYLTYVMPDHTYRTEAGWYKLQTSQYGHVVVVRRKIGGRNWSMDCLVSIVESFKLDPKAGK